MTGISNIAVAICVDLGFSDEEIKTNESRFPRAANSILYGGTNAP